MGKAERLRKIRAQEQDPEAPDRFLPGFTRGSADALRQHCAEAIRGLGYRAWDRGSHLVITGGPFRSPGATLGFTTIAREAARVNEEEWPELVAEIVGQLVSGALAAPPHLGRGELRAELFPRFSALGRISEGQLQEDYSYSRRVGGLPLLLAVRHRQTSAFLADIHLSKAGGPEAAWEAAAANLFEAGLGAPTVYAAASGAAMVVLESEHPRQAAWLAYPERLMEVLGLKVGPLGVLFCVPAHRLLGFHLVTEETTRQDVDRMRDLASILGTDEVAPLSSDLFWWAPGRPVTTDVPVGAPAAVPEGPREFDTMDG